MTAAGLCIVKGARVVTCNDGSSLGNEDRDVVSCINGIAEVGNLGDCGYRLPEISHY